MVDSVVSPVPQLYAGRDAGLRPETRAQVRVALLRGVDPISVLSHVGKAMDGVLARYQSLLPADSPRPACTKGCSYCCHQRVEVTAPEVFALVRQLRKNEKLRHRVEKATQALRGLDGRAHHLAQVACPFLASAHCRVYQVRPLGCRRAHCTDAWSCAESHRHPATALVLPLIPELSFQLSAPVIGYLEGMQLAGRPPHHYELCAALSLALKNPKSEAAWLRGEDPLGSARTRTAEELATILSSAK